MYLDYYILENLLINYIIINCTTYITKIYTDNGRRKNKTNNAKSE